MKNNDQFYLLLIIFALATGILIGLVLSIVAGPPNVWEMPEFQDENNTQDFECHSGLDGQYVCAFK